MASGASEVEDLLSAAPARLPLVQAALRPEQEGRRVHLQDAARLFPGAKQDRGALAGLLLRTGYWEESHTVAQDVQSIEGSYWHGIIHRMEPDSFNAGYWFRQVGEHAIFPELFRGATEILENNGPKHWHLKSVWDPFLFIEWCEEAREKRGQAEVSAIEIQMIEWRLLFDWCAAKDF
jgi:hypothetical protein